MCSGFPYLFWDFSQCTSSPWITLFNSSWLRIHCKSAWQLRKRFVRLVCRSRKVRWQTEKERNLGEGITRGFSYQMKIEGRSRGCSLGILLVTSLPAPRSPIPFYLLLPMHLTYSHWSLASEIWRKSAKETKLSGRKSLALLATRIGFTRDRLARFRWHVWAFVDVNWH